MSSPAIRKVLVISAGAVGQAAITALLEGGFDVAVLTSEHSQAVVPDGIKHYKSDYSQSSLRDAMQGQDAVVCTISGAGFSRQIDFIDAALAAGVKRFLPSEFGVNTASPKAVEQIPVLAYKVNALQQLAKNENKLSWTAIVTGSLFDWALDIPGFGGFDVAARKAILYDGGNTPFEATNLAQAGRAIALVLKEYEATRNQHVYVHSFSTSQRDVVKALENATGSKFQVEEGSVEQLRRSGTADMQAGREEGLRKVVTAAFYGDSGVASYPALAAKWSSILGLPDEVLDDFVEEYIARRDRG